MAHFDTMPNGKTRAFVERCGVRKSAVWATKRMAEDWARKTELALLAKKDEVPRHSFEEAANRYLTDVSANKPGLKWESLRITKMIEHFKDADLARLDASDICGWRDARLKTGVLGATVRREFKLLHNIFAKAKKEWKWLDTNPGDDVEMPPDSDPRTSVWRWREIRRLLRFFGHKTATTPQSKYQEVAFAFLLALRTGLRSKEIMRVNPDTFNPATKVFEIKRKDQKINKVPMTRQAARVCKYLPPAWTLDDAMRDALFRKGRDALLISGLTFHDARATALTLLARKVDVMTLSRISGHKNLRMLLNVYYRETAEEISSRI